MKFKIKMKNEVYDEVHCLMTNIEKLNDGKEIAGWLTGDWKKTEEEYILTLDKFIIPQQKVSGSEVDIDESSMGDVVKEIGIEQCNRIKAHWHIHPFGYGDTSWSTTDEEKIKDWMDIVKGREVFCFLLSSKGTLKGRVVVNMKTKFLNEDKVFRYNYDDIPVEKEVVEEDSKLLSKLQKRIKDKVEQHSYFKQDGIYITSNYTLGKEKSAINTELHTIRLKKHKLYITLDNDFKEYVLKFGSGGLKDKLIFKNIKHAGEISTVYIIPEMNEKYRDTYSDELFALEDDFIIFDTAKPKNKEPEKWWESERWRGYDF